MSVGYNVDVDLHGPVFDERARAVMRDYTRHAEDWIGQQGLSEVHHNLDTSIRHPTPYYETKINVRRERGAVRVNDAGIIYGWWLEGIGSRNAPVTRFAGYFSFKRAAAVLRIKAPQLAERLLRERYLDRLQ
ncbi:hypothetical protein J5X84_36135 [Streptosporangiaceae bacterium NEAU-GS5]|nr:hypothetical protein [Streptosporangiaceae bacterium NEAU-GS5]